MEVRAVLLTTFSVTAPEGLYVHALPPEARLSELAAAALELRTRHPRARLLVAAPEKLVRRLERRYPSLVDVPLTSAEAVERAVQA